MSSAQNVIPGSTQPFLRWAGSKRQLIPVLSQFWNQKYDRYVEPFVGSACLFFSLAPKKALLADINGDLILTYKEVTKELPQVLSELKKLKKNKENYYKIRALESSDLSPNKRAARFIYLNRYCFNGLYRTNSSGKFNVPYCGDERGIMPPNTTFEQCSVQLKNATLFNGRFEKTLEKVRLGDFVYLDPPFSVQSGNIFNEYDASKFSRSDILLLRTWLEKFDHQGITFLVSYADSEEANVLKKGFNWRPVTVRRSIAGFASKRRRVDEVLISNAPFPSHI